MAAEHGVRGGVGGVGERSAGPAAWTARKFCGIAYDTLRLPPPCCLPPSVATGAFLFSSYREERAKKGIINGYKCI